nr:alpha/beta hydrolase family protein [Ruficoccus amylovorans]
MNVILPQRTQTQVGIKGVVGEGNFPTLYLLHGLTDDHSIWSRRTSIERYVAEMGLAVVMPSVHRSFYTDMDNGSQYWAFISEELPAIARFFFPLSDQREDNYVAGLSMGGYGALKLAFNRPECFCAAASLSGVVELDDWLDFKKSHPDRPTLEFEKLFGPKGSPLRQFGDLSAASWRLVESGQPRPALYQICGQKDFLYAQNLRFRDHLRQIGYEARYEDDPGYGHTWDYWDLTIQRVLKWIKDMRLESSDNM